MGVGILQVDGGWASCLMVFSTSARREGSKSHLGYGQRHDRDLTRLEGFSKTPFCLCRPRSNRRGENSAIHMLFNEQKARLVRRRDVSNRKVNTKSVVSIVTKQT